MPLPIRPQPSTPTRLISVIVFPWWLGWRTPGACRGGVEGLSQLLGDAHQWAGARAGQRVLGSDFAPLEPVEHLLERHLDPLVLGAVAPGHEDPGAPEHRAGDEQDRVMRAIGTVAPSATAAAASAAMAPAPLSRTLRRLATFATSCT